MLSTLLNNLVANAFQYTGTGVIDIAWRGNALENRASGPAIVSIIKRLCGRCDVVLSIGPLENGGSRAEVKFPA